jgi:hypothetical protein
MLKNQTLKEKNPVISISSQKSSKEQNTFGDEKRTVIMRIAKSEDYIVMEILKFQMDFRVHMKHMKNINEHKF